jgi:hypothetical protein
MGSKWMLTRCRQKRKVRRDETHVAWIESGRFGTASGVQVSTSGMLKSEGGTDALRTRRACGRETGIGPGARGTEEIEFRDKMTDAGDAFGDQYYLVPA